MAVYRQAEFSTFGEYRHQEIVIEVKARLSNLSGKFFSQTFITQLTDTFCTFPPAALKFLNSFGRKVRGLQPAGRISR
jgi:hypothetical protein